MRVNSVDFLCRFEKRLVMADLTLSCTVATTRDILRTFFKEMQNADNAFETKAGTKVGLSEGKHSPN